MLCEFDEEWKPVVGFTLIYEVSNTGSVRLSFHDGVKIHPIKILHQQIERKGYRSVRLRNWLTKKSPRKFVHRLVMEAFRGQCPPGHNTNHLDGNKANNCLTNLQYVTFRENNQHALDTGLRKRREPKKRISSYTGKSKRSKLNAEDVLTIRRLAETMNCTQIASVYGLHRGTVWDIVKGNLWRNVK